MSGIYDLVLEIARSQAEFMMEVVHGKYLIADFGKQKASRFISAKMEDGNLVLDWYLSITVPLLRRREFLELLTAIEDVVPQGVIEMGLRTGRLRRRLILKDSEVGDFESSRFCSRVFGIAERICHSLETTLNCPPLSPADMDRLVIAIGALAGEVDGPAELAKCA